MKNIFGALFMCIFVGLIMFLIIKFDNSGNAINLDGTENISYLNGNDGGYIPVHYIKCVAIRMENTIEVEWNGNCYSCEVDPWSDIQTGDLIMCGFAFYEGEVEFIDIN